MDTQDLLKEAFKAREAAHAPYSRFKVGAALLCDDGSVFTGCNVENASYGLTVCAERVTVFKAVSEGRKKFAALAVVADTPEPVQPCGACLQVLAEFSPKMDLMLIMGGRKGKLKSCRLNQLLPGAFRLKRGRH
ncbi:cytidine deaminase [bacterium]|nr:cytidine deaminase [bacterium]